MLSGDPTLADSLSASIRHTDALALAASVTGVEVDSLIAGYEALPVLDTELVVSLSQPPFDLEAVRAVAGAMIERVDHMDRFADFVFAESEGAVQLLAERSAAAESDSRLALVELPSSSDVQALDVVYPVVQLADAGSPGLANAFIGFLTTETARTIIADHGFGLP